MNQLKILLVDDEPQILESLSQLFDYDYKVLTATSGEAALELLDSHLDTAIVISDQRMGGMRGVDLLRHVKQRIPDSMRILLTGYSDLESVLESVNVGEVFRYVRKPWQPETLRSIVALAAATRILRSQKERTIQRSSLSKESPSVFNQPVPSNNASNQSLLNKSPEISSQSHLEKPPLDTLNTDEPISKDSHVAKRKNQIHNEGNNIEQSYLENDFYHGVEAKLNSLPLEELKDEQFENVNFEREFFSKLTEEALAELRRYESFEEEFFSRLNEANDLDLISKEEIACFDKGFCGKSGKPRILFVDDDSDVLYLLSETFKKDYDIFTCTSAESGTELLEGKSFFACIVADMRMPGQNGADFLIQSEALAPLVPKILMTSHADIEVIVSLINQGLLYRHVAKPYDLPNLKNIIQESVQECRRRIENGMQYRGIKKTILASQPDVSRVTNDEIYYPTKRDNQDVLHSLDKLNRLTKK